MVWAFGVFYALCVLKGINHCNDAWISGVCRNDVEKSDSHLFQYVAALEEMLVALRKSLRFVHCFI